MSRWNDTAHRILTAAALRPSLKIHPTPQLRGLAQIKMLNELRRRALITYGKDPEITLAGILWLLWNKGRLL